MVEKKEERKMAGRPLGSRNKITDSIKVRDAISKVVTNYFTSGKFTKDMALGHDGKKRLQFHMDLLPYTLSKKETIKQSLAGLNTDEQAELVLRIKSELKS